MITKVVLEEIRPNPWQTREGEPNAEYIQDLALDIATNGLLQMPVGRRDGLQVQLAFGHNRLAAYRWLAQAKPDEYWTTMSVDLRDLTDMQMALFAWSENEKRRDVTPVERARAIQKRMAAFGWTQAQAAEALGISRPVVSNALRLLELPEEVQKGMAEGKISERVGLALAGLFDLPESLRKQAVNEWDSEAPKNIVKAALAGEITSDGIRKRVEVLCGRFGIKLEKAIFGLEKAVEGEEIVSATCKGCEQRYAQRNLCLAPDCFQAKTTAYKAAYLTGAVEACGIPMLEADREDKGYYGGKYSELPKRMEETIIAGKCENLRVRFQAGQGNMEGFEHARIVCGKMAHFCTCVQGLEATAPVISHSYDEEAGKFVQHVDPGAVQLETEQPSAEELKEAAREARRAKRLAEQEKQAALGLMAERIAAGLGQGNLQTWKWLAGEIHYQLKDQVKPMDNVFDVRAAIARHLNAGLAYPDTLAKAVRLFNKELKECGLEELEEAATTEQTEYTEKGKALVEVFGLGEAGNG